MVRRGTSHPRQLSLKATLIRPNTRIVGSDSAVVVVDRSLRLSVEFANRAIVTVDRLLLSRGSLTQLALRLPQLTLQL
jgi:hypothetical protein